jgi:hypothetical protein
MMMNQSLRDMIFPEFSGGGYSASGGGGLGEPGYGGRIADQSKPPGWTPDPRVWDPYSGTPGGDPFYSALNTAARQTQEPWIGTNMRDVPNIFTRDPLTREIFRPDIETDRSSTYLVADNDTKPPGTDYNPVISDTAPGTAHWLYQTVDGSYYEISVHDGVIEWSRVESDEEVIVTAQRLPPSVPAGQPPSAPSAAATIPPVGGPQPSIASLTEEMLYQDLKESGYSTAALNRLNEHYEEQFPLSGGNLRELLLKRSAAFATAFGGQWRQGDYRYALGNAEAGLLDLAGATIAGESWKQTVENLAKGILIGGALGAAFGTLGGSGAASGAAGDTGGALAPELDSALASASSESSPLGEYQWGAPLRPSSANTQVYTGFPLRPNPPEVVIPRTYTPLVLDRAAAVGPGDLGHNFPSLLDPIILSGPRYLRFGNPFQTPAIVYSSEGYLFNNVGRYEIGVIEDGIFNERIIHRGFTGKKRVLP